MNTKKTWVSGVTVSELRGMRGVAAAIIRQAFDDAGARTAPMVEIIKNFVKPCSTRIKLGELSENELISYKKPENSGKEKISKEKMIKEILGKKVKNTLEIYSLNETWHIKEVENSKHKILYNQDWKQVGYIEGKVVYRAQLEMENNKVKIFTQKTLKRKSQSSQLLSKAECDEARGFILAESNYWKTALEFWCDVAELDWAYIVKLAKQQKWYPDHLKGIR